MAFSLATMVPPMLIVIPERGTLASEPAAPPSVPVPVPAAPVVPPLEPFPAAPPAPVLPAAPEPFPAAPQTPAVPLPLPPLPVLPACAVPPVPADVPAVPVEGGPPVEPPETPHEAPLAVANATATATSPLANAFERSVRVFIRALPFCEQSFGFAVERINFQSPAQESQSGRRIATPRRDDGQDVEATNIRAVPQQGRRGGRGRGVEIARREPTARAQRLGRRRL